MGFSLKYVSKTSNIGKTIGKTIPGVSDALGDTPLGEFLGISTKDVWRLKMVDNIFGDVGREFIGQFAALDLTENVGQRVSDTPSLNQQDTDKKYLGGQGDTITFNARVWASSSIRNVRKSVERLKSFSKRNDELKRSPIFTFTAGTELQCTCFVRSVGGIKYDPLRSDGTIRGATFGITLTKIEDKPTDVQGKSIAALIKSGLGIVSAAAGLASVLGKINIPGGSLHTKGKQVIVKQGQTFEHIAQQHYNDALVGDLLRRAYFNKPLSIIKLALEAGDVIDIIDADEVYDIPITPQSVALKDNETNKQNIANHLELRGGSRRIYV